MIWHLDIGWLLMAVASVTVMAFFFGNALHAIIQDDGFGAGGNMTLFVVGFFASIYLTNIYGISLKHMGQACATGLAGAFALIAVLAMIKALVSRLAR